MSKNIEYEVIKPLAFSSLLKEGDILVYKDGSYVFEKEISNDNFHACTKVVLSEALINEYEQAGLIKALSSKDKNESSNTQDNKLNKISSLICQLKNSYNQRKNNIEKKYKEGKLQTCVKVEHDTVYFNLMKVLNKIESIINE